MEFSQIKNLVEQYFDGETSVEQEQKLRMYFSGEEIHQELTLYTPIFRFQTQSSQLKLSSDFQSKLNHTIIDDLIASFFEGETNLEDEKILKNYFSDNAIQEKHKEFAPYFNYTQQEAIPALSTDFSTNFQHKLIDSLLESYFEGTSTLEEEQMLKDYFNGNIEKRHLEYQSLFSLFAHEKEAQLSSDFSDKLNEKLTEGKVVEMKPAESEGKVRRMIPSYWRAAAMIALAIGGLWMLDLPQNNGESPVMAAGQINWSKYEPKNPEEALAQTKAALALFSRKMQEGEEQTLKGFKKIKSANQAIGIN